jgi:flavodoxin
MKAIVVYGSRTGKCQTMAETISDTMKEGGEGLQ